jgi:hypothetical protein
MAIDEVLETLQGLLADPAVGLAAKTAALALEKGYAAGYVRTDFRWEEWETSGLLQPAGDVNVAIRPRRAVSTQRSMTQALRDGSHVIEITCELVDADATRLQRTINTLATALLQVLDGVEIYSATHGGSIQALEDPIETNFGNFDGAITTSGFITSFTVLDRSPR